MAYRDPVARITCSRCRKSVPLAQVRPSRSGRECAACRHEQKRRSGVRAALRDFLDALARNRE